MEPIKINFSNVSNFVNKEEINELINGKREVIKDVLNPIKENSDVLGWVNLDQIANEDLVCLIEEKAKEIRENADVFLLIGIGGSNQGSRAIIESMGDGKVKTLYVGTNLSPDYMNKIMEQIKGKSVYVNIIAKNFATLEPGITFRVIRNYMEKTYGAQEAAKRIITTGSMNNSNLQRLSNEKGYLMLPFPLDVGGRFSVLTAVGLLPIAVSGVSIREVLNGAKDIKHLIHTTKIEENDAVIYAAIRNILLKKGYDIEIMAYFEPLLGYFTKWWVQLLGESEGKEGKGIFPTACAFTEDLHSLGQYIQEGQRKLFETFLNIKSQQASCLIPHEETDVDDFGYIDGKDFQLLNSAAYEATVKAHVDGGVPCLTLDIPALTPYYMGQMFFFFEYVCYLSATILGVNPFDQPGVEAYKINMFATLKK